MAVRVPNAKMCRSAAVTAGIRVTVPLIVTAGIVMMSGRQAEMTGIGTATAKVACSVVGIVIVTNAQTVAARGMAIRTVIRTVLTVGLIQTVMIAGMKEVPAACREVTRIITGMPTVTGTMNATPTTSVIHTTVARAVRIITATATLTAVTMTISGMTIGVHRIVALTADTMMIGGTMTECNQIVTPATVAGTMIDMTARTMTGLTTGATVM